ncbi:MAG: phosphofructokinase [Betaproteobacteria bacterium HGW-Betaproteobacteria-3]|jgi:6-phosphofructokinase 2|nr:MAG: phosphofructokinase [Betaproteobacteria bacterium HGW-Betaproteobacteria-3]
MPDILTLTMNPALDVWTSTERVTGTHKLRCSAAQWHPGGGGINVARVLRRLGSDCLALYLAGGMTGQRLTQLLEAEQVPRQCIDIAGETRESFSVHERASGLDYRFVLPGPTLRPHEWDACIAYLRALAPAPRYLVVSGSLPPGAPRDLHAQLARLARASGSRLVVDTSGPALAAALEEGVYLIKPSLRELRELTGQPLTHEPQWLAAAQQIVCDGRAEMVALSLGAQGAVLVSRDATVRAQGLAVPVASTIGAGDSFLGGLLWALSRAMPLEQALRQAMAAGAAALLGPGTALCQATDVARLRDEVRLTRLG